MMGASHGIGLTTHQDSLSAAENAERHCERPPDIFVAIRSRSRRWQISRPWELPQGRSVSLWQRLTPPQLFVGSFALLLVLGTLSLKLLPGIYRGEPLNWLDACFIATSAVCVTGLSVVDVEATFTFVGQVVLLVQIQLGGLGMLAFTSLIISLFGGRVSLRAESLTAESRKLGPHVDVRRLTLDIVRFTFLIESAGALLLYFFLIPRHGFTAAIWPAVFHSVSCFCSAGFSTYSTSMMGFRESPAILLTLSALGVIGGIGFITMEEMYFRFLGSDKKRLRRLSTHSRLALVTSLLLLLVAWPLFASFEWQGCLHGLSLTDKLCNAFFMSAMPRTVGFTAIDYGQASDSTNFLTILLMTIGGAPGSTAGGMKTTTFALVLLFAWSRLRHHETTIFGNRSIPEETIQRAVGLAVISTAVLAIAIFLLAMTEHSGSGSGGNFLARMFEAASAFNTVGLSMGMTPSMSSASRILIIFLMFLGRIGPVTLATALVIRHVRKTHFRYAYEDVVVG